MLIQAKDFQATKPSPSSPPQGPPTSRNLEFKAKLAEEGVYGLLRLPLVHVAPPLVINEEELRDGFARVSRAISATLDRDFE